MNDILSHFPSMLTGQELYNSLTVLPSYTDDIRQQSKAERLIALSDISKIYIPSTMTEEIYNKLHLAVIRSLNKKTSVDSVIQRNNNHRRIIGLDGNGILGGSDSFTIIGQSGIGKSCAIGQAIRLLSQNGILEPQKPSMKIIPCIVVQCPFDCSAKGMLYEILRIVDEAIGSDYYRHATKNRATTDMLIGMVSQVAINHIGVLIVDEIQNVVNNKNGKSLVGLLTQLINSSGISICMVGTPECTSFFTSAQQLSRRSLGLQYSSLEYDQFFRDFCRIVFSFQYTKNRSEISDATTLWLYEHSGGILSAVIGLIQDAQEIAILTGAEKLTQLELSKAYETRMTMLHPYIAPKISARSQTKAHKVQQICLPTVEESPQDCPIIEIVQNAKRSHCDVVSELKKHIKIEAVHV